MGSIGFAVEVGAADCIGDAVGRVDEGAVAAASVLEEEDFSFGIVLMTIARLALSNNCPITFILVDVAFVDTAGCSS